MPCHRKEEESGEISSFRTLKGSSDKVSLPLAGTVFFLRNWKPQLDQVDHTRAGSDFPLKKWVSSPSYFLFSQREALIAHPGKEEERKRALPEKVGYTRRFPFGRRRGDFCLSK